MIYFHDCHKINRYFINISAIYLNICYSPRSTIISYYALSRIKKNVPRSFPIYTFIYRQKMEQNYFLLSSTFWQIYLASWIDRRIQLAWHIRHFIIYSHTSHLCIGRTYIYYNYRKPFLHIYIYIYIDRNNRNNDIIIHCLCHWNF